MKRPSHDLPPAPAGGLLVGGAVRDLLLGRDTDDFDWLVAHPQASAREMAARLDGSAFPLDAERGFWRVVSGAGTFDFIPLEGGLESELRGRDFTVNAMALTPAGELIDPLDGQRDLRRQQLRMTSEAALHEDPLRLYRAVRLAVRLGFTIESATRAAVSRTAGLLAREELPLPAAERIREELDATIMSAAAGAGFSELEELGLLNLVAPELSAGRGVEQPAFHHLDVLDHSLEALQRLVSIFPEADAALRWATLLHDVGKPSTREVVGGRPRFYGHDREGARIAARILRRLRAPLARQKRVASLVRHHMLPLPTGERAARRFVHRRRELLPDLLQLMIADREAARGPLASEASRRAYRVALSRILAILAEPPPPQPLLDGQEIMELLGLAPGPRVGEAVRFLAEARSLGDVRDRADAQRALLTWARAQGWLE